MKKLENIIDKSKIFYEEFLKNHTTFHIGGKAKVMLCPTNSEDIINIVNYCKFANEDLFVLGGGSNILVSDRGIDKVVLKLGKNFSEVNINNDIVEAQAGIMNKDLANILLENNLSGFEFASGIPGTLGGAVFMNAGAYDSEMKNVIISVKTIDKLGNIKVYKNEDLNFSYRYSKIMDNDEIILSATLKLSKSNYDEIKEKMEDLRHKRESKQPLCEYSAGSTFKRPKDNFASKLIEDAGLKGFTEGNAKVSEKHSGFVINTGECTFKEMRDFLDIIKKKVYNFSGIMLEEEVRIIED